MQLPPLEGVGIDGNLTEVDVVLQFLAEASPRLGGSRSALIQLALAQQLEQRWLRRGLSGPRIPTLIILALPHKAIDVVPDRLGISGGAEESHVLVARIQGHRKVVDRHVASGVGGGRVGEAVPEVLLHTLRMSRV